VPNLDLQIMDTETVFDTGLAFLTHSERRKERTNPFKSAQVMKYFLQTKNHTLKETDFY
jgi:hypothetical protein